MNRRRLILSILTMTACGRAGAALDGGAFADEGGEVRLADVLAPDLSFSSDARLYAREARAALDRLLAGPLRIEPVGPPDRWGRRVAHVYRAGETISIQQRLVAAGAFRVRPESADYAFIRRLLETESEARAERRGLWRIADYHPKSAEDARDAIGAFHLVEGEVVAAAKYGSRIYLNFGDDYRTDFTVTIRARDGRGWREQGLIDWQGLAGARIRARGYVASINGPSIAAAHPLQIERLAASGRNTP